MKLIAGLGNPGSRYKNTYHNIGFIALDSLANKLKVEFSPQKKFFSDFGQGSLEKNKFILIKPLTYMNLSGKALLAVVNYFKIEKFNILVVHDDLDMPFGKLRYRQKGSHGGNGGVRDIINQLGNNEFKRLKIGIGRSNFLDPKQHVLSLIDKDKQTQLTFLFAQSNQALVNFLLGRPINIQNQDLK